MLFDWGLIAAKKDGSLKGMLTGAQMGAPAGPSQGGQNAGGGNGQTISQGRQNATQAAMELTATGYVNVETRCDGGPWEPAGGAHGKTTAFLPIVPRRCDKFEIRLSGKGECAILSMVRQLRAGSEV